MRFIVPSLALLALVTGCGSSSGLGDSSAAAGDSSAGGMGGQSGLGGSGGGAGSSAKYPDLSAFCAAVAMAECSNAVTNACNLAFPSCTEAVQSHCLMGLLDFAPTNRLTLYVPTLGDACIDALAAAYASQPIPAGSYANARDTCARAFSERTPNAGACNVDADCASGFCWYSTAPVVGTCQVMSMVAAGNECAAAGSTCPDGFKCAMVDPTRICVVVQNASGDSCSIIDPCQTGLICDNVDANGMGFCGAPHLQGEACLTDAQCGSSGLACLAAGGIGYCQMELAFGPGSMSCAGL